MVNILDLYPPAYQPQSNEMYVSGEDIPPYNNHTVMKPGERPIVSNPNEYLYGDSNGNLYPYDSNLDNRYITFS